MFDKNNINMLTKNMQQYLALVAPCQWLCPAWLRSEKSLLPASDAQERCGDQPAMPKRGAETPQVRNVAPKQWQGPTKAKYSCMFFLNIFI